MPDIRLAALDGSNLLGYLAALGTLRTVSRVLADVTLRWEEETFWSPILNHAELSCEDDLVERIAGLLCGEETIDAAWKIGKDLTLLSADFATVLRQTLSATTWDDRTSADFLSAFGAELPANDEKMTDTAFRTMSGAGHQHFLGFMQQLAADTSREHLERALFRVWDYQDPAPSMRWDPLDYRPHALRAINPSTDPIKTIRGANRLAIEALPLFPTVPTLRKLQTAGFSTTDGDTVVDCPIWTEELTLPVIGSLLASSGQRFRVAQVFRCTRFTEGKFRNFSPSRPLL